MDEAFQLGAPARGFGPNETLVARALERLAMPTEFDWDAANVGAQALARSLSEFPGTGSPAQRFERLAADLRHYAENLDPRMARDVSLAVNDVVSGYCDVHVPLASQAAAIAVVESAVLWPAVFGAHRNPLDRVLDLVPATVFPTVEDGSLVVFHVHLAQLVPIPEPVPAPTLTIVRQMPGLGE